MRLMTTRILLLTLFVSLLPFANAQTAPYPGATWYFSYQSPIWFESGMERWEYIGDSVAADGIYRKMHVRSRSEAIIKYLSAENPQP